MKLKLVLIIEANNQLRYEWEDLLRGQGYPVLSAPDVKRAMLVLINFPMNPEILIHDEREELTPELMVPLRLASSHLTTQNLVASVKAIK